MENKDSAEKKRYLQIIFYTKRIREDMPIMDGLSPIIL
jgi:hypothetical protein